MRSAARLSRFESAEIDPSRVRGLRADAPAVVEKRTMFPNTVVGPFESARFLVSGHNSPKIGKVVEKGPWTGMPIFTLTLEERKTCPATCHEWRTCYGNGMPLARRNDALDGDFIPALKAEIITLVREHCSTNPLKPDYVPARGIVIRLHVLGDFYSVAYVHMWRDILAFLPEVHVFGYTARHVDSPDPESRAIAEAIAELTDTQWDRFAIRTSHPEAGPQRSIVVDEIPHESDVIHCPAQAKATEVCGTCALCWSAAARGKTIAFLRHGPKVAKRSPEAQDFADVSVAPVQDERRGGNKPGKAAGRTPWGGGWKGTADEYLTTTAEERRAATPEDVKAEIAKRYGAVWKK